LPAHPPQGRGLGFSSPLGQRLREIRKKNRKPQPQRNMANETGGGFPFADQGLDPKPSGEKTDHFDYKHHRVARHFPGVKFPQGVKQGVSVQLSSINRLFILGFHNSPPSTNPRILKASASCGEVNKATSAPQ
jgi:hypothetical protein